jgi:hypothetical protein
MSARPVLLLILPELGGLGKSTVAEQLVGILEAADRPVLALDGDPSSRGLLARRSGRKTTVITWPDEPTSRAGAIRGAVLKGGVGVLDFGAGSSQTLSVDPTISELCDGKHEVETIIVLIGEASKPGNATAIKRVRQAYPDVRTIFCRNFKSGNDWSSFTHVVAGLPVINIPAIPSSITAWLSNYRVVTDSEGEVSRPALVDIAMDPQEGYTRIAATIRDTLNSLSQQPVMQSMFKLPRLSPAFPIGQGYGLAPGPMDNHFLMAHDAACWAATKIATVKPPRPGEDEKQWVDRMGREVLAFARARQKMEDARLAATLTR